MRGNFSLSTNFSFTPFLRLHKRSMHDFNFNALRADMNFTAQTKEEMKLLAKVSELTLRKESNNISHLIAYHPRPKQVFACELAFFLYSSVYANIG